MSQDLLTCPTDCSSTIPEVEVNSCNPELLDGEITYLLIANGDQPFANIQDAAEHSSRTSDSDQANTAVRKLLGIGSFVTEFGAERAIPGGKVAYAKNSYTLNFKVYDNNDVNYEFMRSTSCNMQWRVWPITSTGKILGGNTGISVILKGKGDVPESRDELWILEFQGKYTANRPPVRDDYPLASGDSNLI